MIAQNEILYFQLFRGETLDAQVDDIALDSPHIDKKARLHCGQKKTDKAQTQSFIWCT